MSLVPPALSDVPPSTSISSAGEATTAILLFDFYIGASIYTQISSSTALASSISTQILGWCLDCFHLFAAFLDLFLPIMLIALISCLDIFADCFDLRLYVPYFARQPRLNRMLFFTFML
ncbi:hypothetical protein L6452_12166 [Arctium lappa]|uniref:Uncharacterized protein n=1 Tax=Arctium lappa TaxID=4217 RepID=A0ACB9DQX0_ARCLA|nr:hypothetical protein L6452_12166 [Arctium lappa]